MSAGDKAIILSQVENGSRGKRQALHVTRDTKKQLLSVAPGATRFEKPEKTVEPDHRRRRRQVTVGSPGVS